MGLRIPEEGTFVKYVIVNGVLVVGDKYMDHHRVLIARMFGASEGLTPSMARTLVEQRTNNLNDVDMGRVRRTTVEGVFEILDRSTELGFPKAQTGSNDYVLLRSETAKLFRTTFPEDFFEALPNY
jgi:hypothetical protein